MIQKVIFGGLFMSFLLLNGCETAKKASRKSADHDFSLEHYQNLGSNLNRLIEMRKGVFVQYLHDLEGERPDELWSLNDGQDSAIFVVRQVGDPNKDGHWLFLYNFMSHLPENPLAATFQKMEISPNSRDTIICTSYRADDLVSFEQAIDPDFDFSEIDLDELEASGEVLTFVSKSTLEFEGRTNLKLALTKAADYKYRMDYYTVIPQDSKVKVVFYKEKGSEAIPYRAIQRLVKLPKKNVFYPNCTAYDDKEK